MNTSVDLSPILTPALEVLGAVLASLVSAAFVWAVNELRKKNILQTTDQQVQAMRGSIQTSAGIAMSNLAIGLMPMESVKIGNPEMRSLALRAIAAVPTAAGALGVTEASATQMVVGAIGQAIGADPTIPTVPVITLSKSNATDAKGAKVSEASTSTTTTIPVVVAGSLATPPRPNVMPAPAGA